MSTEPSAGGAAGESIKLREVWILYLREMRAALREKSIVLNSVLIPVLLYPLLMWAIFTGLTFVMGQTEGLVARVAVSEWPSGHPKLRWRIEHATHLQVSEAQGSAAALEGQIRSGSLDAWLQFLPATNTPATSPSNFVARITYDQSRERSLEAYHRVAGLVDNYRADWLRRDGRRRGLTAAAWQVFTLAVLNTASEKQMGSFILGMVAPLLFVVMVAVGCFHPAVDALAGERERNTWETLMSSGPSRLSILTSKYLYVATFGGIAGILNLAAILLTLRPVFAPLLTKVGKTIECSIPLQALPIAVCAAVLLAGFIAAGMMMFAVFARTFKEGQAMITPFYMLTLLPVMFLQAPGLTFSMPLACVPIVNLTLMVREALAGVFHWPQIAIAVATSILVIAACLRLATVILRFEDVVLGSYAGTFQSFVRERIIGGKHKQRRSATTASPHS